MSTIDLLHRHPLHVAKRKTWLENQDFYRAGDAVLEPGRVIGNVSFATVDAETEDSSSVAAERPRARGRFISVGAESYLHSHPREAQESYKDRQARADHYPVFRDVVDIYTSATLKTPPTRESDDPVWKTYWEDVDRHGTPIDGFVRDALTWALVFGHEFAVTDRPYFEGQAASRDEQIKRGDRAYSYLVDPTDVLDWVVDRETGKFRWVTIREDAPDVRSPGEEAKGLADWVRVWGQDAWALYSPASAPGRGPVTWELQSSGTHPCGEPPISVLYARRGAKRRRLDADSMLAGLARGDRAAFNYRSLLDEVLYGQAFAMLWVPDDEGGSPGPIDIGIGIANGFNSANGTPLMLSPEAALLLAIWKILHEHMQTLRQTYGVGRGKAEHSKEERSAEALTVESRNENNRAASLAECCEEFDQSMHRFAAKWEGKDDVPQAEFSKDVSLRALSKQLNDALSIKKLGAPWEVMVEIVKPLVAEHMKEQGRPKDAIKRVLDAFDAAPDPTVNPEVAAAVLEKVDDGS